ncbi:prostatic acid phosphatase-like [Phymastichus coffea]|uniref:prostatic acid phosphatase-like n=1 Tax=Phymastichus coffea TaxID=108790 RepID=UPI00273B2BF4|nr:prostatic acid phosphatase-like [Phymastichus coffea]XP_058806642.1 prostatic acid phosphatase-like [Phymastichus coffea]XP_058806643.1 prostatic acid phosphatase-like [Phymastichus coffea]
MPLFALISLLSIVQIGSSNEILGKIIFANILFRHGDRTPVEPYPNDPYKNESLWPVPFGQLTNLGKHQHLILGKWLRNRYSHILPLKYSLYDIYVISTDVDRTLMSAEANLAGLYPPIGGEIWDIKKWMPIPVHTIPENEDHILAGKKYCDKYAYELQRVLTSPEMKKIDEDNAELYKYLSQVTGKSISSLETIEYLYNTLYIEELYNKTLPAWTENVYPDKMKSLASKSFTIQAYNKILQRLKMGPLLKDMIEHMKLKSKHALIPNRKLWIYSAHDDTIANMMMTLGVFEPHCPPYAAVLLIELRLNNQNNYVVTIFYKNSTGEPTLLTLPGCLGACPLNQFIKLTKDVIPDNWDRECLLAFENYNFSNNTIAIIAILMLSVLTFIILMVMIVAFFFWHYKREHEKYYARLSMDA